MGHEQVLCMLEGGNEQLSKFFDRHKMGGTGTGGETTNGTRYKTKAAQFYRTNLSKHAATIANSGLPYLGREASRKKSSSGNGKQQKEQQQQQQQQLCVGSKATSVVASASARAAHKSNHQLRRRTSQHNQQSIMLHA